MCKNATLKFKLPQFLLPTKKKEDSFIHLTKIRLNLLKDIFLFFPFVKELPNSANLCCIFLKTISHDPACLPSRWLKLFAELNISYAARQQA